MNSKILLYLICFNALIGGLAQNVYLPNLPQVQHDLHTNTYWVNLTVSIFTITMAVMQIVFGPIADRRSKKNVLQIGLLIFIAASFGCAFSNSVFWLLAFRLIQGVGAAAVPVVAVAIIGDLFEGEKRMNAMGTFQLIVALSPALGPLIGGVIGARSGFLGVFLFLGCAGILLTITNSLLMKENFVKTQVIKALNFSSILSVFSHYKGRGIMIIGFVQAFSTMTLMVFLPSIFLHRYNFGAEGTGIAFLMMALCFMIAVRGGVTLQKKMGMERAFIYASWLNVSTYALVAVCSIISLPLLIGSFCVFGITFGFTLPIPPSLLSDLFEQDRAAANGVYNSMRLFGSGLAPMAGSVLYVNGGSVVLYGAVMVLYGISVWVGGHYLLRNKVEAYTGGGAAAE